MPVAVAERLFADSYASITTSDTPYRRLADMNRKLAEHDEHHTGGRRFLHDSLRLLTDAHRDFQHSSDADRRIANQAFYTRLDITDDEQLRPRLPEPFATIVREAHKHSDDKGEGAEHEHDEPTHVACSRKTLWVDRGGLHSHEWKRVERLEAAWELARRGIGSAGSAADSGLGEAVTEPTRRSRTPLTAKQIDAIHTARENGESVMSIARRFEVHRATVWEKSRSRNLGDSSRLTSCISQNYSTSIDSPIAL